jgi:hypothetical protein
MAWSKIGTRLVAVFTGRACPARPRIPARRSDAPLGVGAAIVAAEDAAHTLARKVASHKRLSAAAAHYRARILLTMG